MRNVKTGLAFAAAAVLLIVTPVFSTPFAVVAVVLVEAVVVVVATATVRCAVLLLCHTCFYQITAPLLCLCFRFGHAHS